MTTANLFTECCRLSTVADSDATRRHKPSLRKSIAIVTDARSLPYQNIESLHEAHFVGVTHGRFAILLDPFGMLDPQVVMNLFTQVCVRPELVDHNQRILLVISVPRPLHERPKSLARWR